MTDCLHVLKTYRRLSPARLEQPFCSNKDMVVIYELLLQIQYIYFLLYCEKELLSEVFLLSVSATFENLISENLLLLHKDTTQDRNN